MRISTRRFYRIVTDIRSIVETLGRLRPQQTAKTWNLLVPCREDLCRLRRQSGEQDARTHAKWGIDYLKYDWC